eukprot:TRINITY_DN14510_c0_g2_i1.p1 TRINITY_DN14510_c0_g2~~TRINITY_DN14510_c0_g2_i1.p1  ORF type:complete len:383 (+),score=88.21 TRINITY_DN14510_c0_g2_i1:95-1150(+)
MPGGGAGGAGPGGFDPMQMLFGGGLGNADPAVVEQLFAAMHGGHPGGFNPGAADDGDPGKKVAPGVSASTLRNLPRVKVTAYDIAANESPECSICLDDLVIGESALRLPCGHLFHEECVKDWLKKSNECPVCRWELPTDDQEYERGRLQRMSDRKIRLHHIDLAVKTAAELRRLAHFIGLDVKDCLEKNEIVDKISRSPQVHIITSEPEASPGGSAPSRPAVERQPMFSRIQLESIGISDLKAIMQRLGVPGFGCQDKAEMIRHLADAGLLLSDEEAEAKLQAAPEKPAEEPQAQDAAPVGGAVPSDDRPLASRSVAQLRQLARELGVSLDGCLEKGEIVQRISASPAFRG